MAVMTGSIVIYLLLALVPLFVLIYRWLASINNFWKDRGVPYVKPILLFGNYKDILLAKRPAHEIQAEIYEKLDGEKFGGYFEMVSPCLMVRDPELIEKVLVKDFSHFVDRRESLVDVEREPLSTGLSLLKGNQWRHMRHKLTPTFTSGKLKGMFEQIYNCGEELLKQLQGFAVRGEDVDSKTVMSLFSSDVIASCALGLQFKQDSGDCVKFRKIAESLFNPTRMQTMKFLLGQYSAKLAKIVGALNFPKETSQYFLDMTNAIIDYRDKNNIKRNDFLQLLLNVREQEKSGKTMNVNHELMEEDAYLKQDDSKLTSDDDKLELTDDVLAAQAFIFLTAGSETVSQMTSYTLYSLSVNPAIQEKTKQEVDEKLAKHGGWTYQAVKEMTYLDQVVQESLRLNAINVDLNRIVTSPYQIPGTDLVLEKGVRVNIPMYALHMDPRIYPDPHTFNPERFKDNHHKTSWKYLPFGDGPRMCIGMRFALLEMKTCLAKILSRFSVSLSDKTPNPLQFQPTLFPRPKSAIWLYFHERAPLTT